MHLSANDSLSIASMNNSALWDAAQSGNETAIFFILGPTAADLKHKIDTQNEDGLTVLHVCCLSGHVEVIYHVITVYFLQCEALSETSPVWR